MKLEELQQIKDSLDKGMIVSKATWLRVLDWAITLTEHHETPTYKMCKAGINAYEDLMGGDRLPDGDGYDSTIVTGIYAAMSKARKECM